MVESRSDLELLLRVLHCCFDSNLMKIPHTFKLLATSLSVITLAGCASFDPTPLQQADIASQAKLDKEKVAKEIEPITGPMTLEEAIARAIKYNADRRVKAMEEAVAYGTLDLSNFDMLPKVVAGAGYRNRNNDLITRIPGSQGSLTSSREVTTTDLSFTWSLLDFGQSYYASKQNADRLLIAMERRRKALHNLVQDVRTAYWRVVAADKLGKSIRETITDAEAALQTSESTEGAMLRSPMEPLRYQRQLLENLRMLETVDQELSTAKLELAALTSLPMGTQFTVVEPKFNLSKTWLSTSTDEMELHAIVNNPDMRESIYNTRIAQAETKRAMLKMFPGISFSYGNKSSNDEYLVNQSWKEAGAQISFNLLGILSAPAQSRLAELGVSLTDQKRIASHMAVISQLHIARLQYENSSRQYERATKIANVDQRMADHSANLARVEKVSKQESVAQQTASILSNLRRYQALSNAQTAASKLQATLGLEPVIAGSDNMPLAELTSVVAKSLADWESGVLPKLPAQVKW